MIRPKDLGQVIQTMVDPEGGRGSGRMKRESIIDRSHVRVAVSNINDESEKRVCGVDLCGWTVQNREPGYVEALEEYLADALVRVA